MSEFPTYMAGSNNHFKQTTRLPGASQKRVLSDKHKALLESHWVHYANDVAVYKEIQRLFWCKVNALGLNAHHGAWIKQLLKKAIHRWSQFKCCNNLWCWCCNISAFYTSHLCWVNQRDMNAAGVILVDYSGNLCTITRGWHLHVGITTRPRHLDACTQHGDRVRACMNMGACVRCCWCRSYIVSI